MNRREPAQSFEAARRQHLIDATIEALADVGFKAASLNQIAQRADVSTGLFAHYFGDKDGLLEATLRYMAVRLARATRDRLALARNARDRLYAVPDSALADEEFDRRTSAVWLAFWGQITHSTRYQRIQLIYQHRMLSNLRHDLRCLVPADRVERYAMMIASMIDGTWIRSHASAQQADAAKARALVRDLIDELIDSAAGEMSAAKAPATTRGPALPKPLRVASRRKIETAIAQANGARETWNDTPLPRRVQILWSAADAVQREAYPLAAIEARETGRAIASFLAHTLPRAVQLLRHAAETARGSSFHQSDLGCGATFARREAPLGILAVAGRWSSPLLDAVRHAGPALAAGNAVIYQAPSTCSGVASRLAEMLVASGMPAGLFQTLEEIDGGAHALAAYPDVSLALPRLEKAATIVFDDMDPVQAADIVLRDTSPWRFSPDYSETRVFVERRAASAFGEALVAAAARIRVGDPLDQATKVGFLASAEHAASVINGIEDALRGGAHLLLDQRAGPDRKMGVTILADCPDGGRITRESLHAPLVAFGVFAKDDELAGRLAVRDNIPIAGLGILSRDESRARRLCETAQVPFSCLAMGTSRDPGDSVSATGETLATADTYSRHCHILATRN